MINFVRLSSRSSALDSWHATGGCVASDPYMQVSEQEFNSNTNIDQGATACLILNSLALGAQLIFMASGFIYANKEGK